MNQGLNSRRFRRLVIVPGALLLLVFSFAVLAAPQEEQHVTISTVQTRLVYPMDISEFKVGDRAVTPYEAFTVRPDWLKNLSFRVTNKLDKTVNFVTVQLIFPETTYTYGAVAGFSLNRGKWPGSAAVNPPIKLGPNESAVVWLAPNYDDLKASLKHFLLDRPTEVNIRIQEVIYDDGMRFSTGEWLKPNPDPNADERHKWIKVE